MNLPNHFRVPQIGLVARWAVTGGPVGTLDLTVRVLSADTDVPPADIRVLLFP
jgi:hypothetical protein